MMRKAINPQELIPDIVDICQEVTVIFEKYRLNRVEGVLVLSQVLGSIATSVILEGDIKKLCEMEEKYK